MTRSAFAICVLWLAGCTQPHAHLLEDARTASGCESVTYQGAEGDVYLIDACGKVLRMRCLSEWKEPWCCQVDGTPPRTDCAAHEPAQRRPAERALPGLNTPQ